MKIPCVILNRRIRNEFGCQKNKPSLQQIVPSTHDAPGDAEEAAVVGHRDLFVAGEETRQLLIPDPDGVRTLPRPPRPAESAFATHAEVTEGKHPQERGHCLGVLPPPGASRAGGLCCVWVSGPWSGLRSRPERTAVDHLTSRI